MADSMTYEGWVEVFRSGTDYEADLVRDRLEDSDIKAVVMSKRDHAWNLTIGDAAKVFVMVPPEYEAAARAVLASEPVTDEELTAAALKASPSDEAAPEDKTLFDSGAEKIHLVAPSDDDSQ